MVIKAHVDTSKYERFSITLPKDGDFRGFSGGLVANTQMEAIGICSAQLGEGLLCQYITEDKYH